MDLMAAKLGANMAISELVENGQVGRVESKRQIAAEPVIIPAGDRTVRGIKANYDYLIDGATYIVTIGGVEHKTVCIYYWERNCYLGNPSLVDVGENTGEPFGIEIVYHSNMNFCWIALTENVTKDTPVTIELLEETIHTIDPKYLPKGNVGYTETKRYMAAETIIPQGKTQLWLTGAANAEYAKGGEKYLVTFDGVEYELVSTEDEYSAYVGNLSVKSSSKDDTGEPFLFVLDKFEAGYSEIYLDEPRDKDIVVTCELIEEITHTIDPKYLPNPADLPASWVADLKTALGLA